ncbi:MAG TPA: methionine adenosyltransferase [Bacteroidales bacterium]|jgi:S-adenosylmethionine synthetase|nr:methionine adenosyltransferase [Bacteroidales bacterium]HPB89162.1 methionine adenosyltransferase [Bacteroidales bacterium]HPH52609.1 methionine adenosyltransferase [Bacteroidales bacterium]HPY21530.1 methionine adenosyltransferase [Bacteroidales bacterium]HQN24032.1 methionine adenosyltransferase [Bacteroidales bacterium]
MSYLFTSESVSEGHPDKVADQISDSILDDFLRQDPESRVACETFVSTGLVIIGGEITSKAYVDIQSIARNTIRRIGYTKSEYRFDADSCAVISAIHEQSPDIAQGVDQEEQGAGDQGMMFGYACKDTEEYMPLPVTLSHILLLELSKIRREFPSPMPYLRPDAKSQFTVEYDDNNIPRKIHTIVLSTQHDEDVDRNKIEGDVRNILLPRLLNLLTPKNKALFKDDFILHVNPTGKFVIGGPHGDTGLTGRKIVVDTYGGKGAHGGGAFSGKDASKVDRSAAYAARYIAKNMVAAGVADEMLVQISYAIGVAKPLSIFVNTYGTSKVGKSDGEIAAVINECFDLRPAVIIEKFGLKNPIYSAAAAYGHFGRDPFVKEMELIRNGKKIKENVQFFGWEKLDAIERCKALFKI